MYKRWKIYCYVTNFGKTNLQKIKNQFPIHESISMHAKIQFGSALKNKFAPAQMLSNPLQFG